jgi:hypothetical protein
MMEDKQSLEHNLKQVQEELDMAVEKSDAIFQLYHGDQF